MLRLGGGSTSARQDNREQSACLYVFSVSFKANMGRFWYFWVANREQSACLYGFSVSFRAEMERFWYFWVMNGKFHLFLPNFSSWIFFDVIFYFLWIFQAKNCQKRSILTFVRLKAGIRWSLFDLEICECIYESIKLIIVYCTYFISFNLDFLIVKYFFFT